MKKSTLYLKYEFSEDELKEMSETVCLNIDEAVRLKAEKKASNKHFSEQIKALEETNQDFAHKINDGFDHREIAVEIHYNKPKDGMKTIIRMDTNTVHEVVAMDEGENTLENLPLPGQTEEE